MRNIPLSAAYDWMPMRNALSGPEPQRYRTPGGRIVVIVIPPGGSDVGVAVVQDIETGQQGSVSLDALVEV